MNKVYLQKLVDIMNQRKVDAMLIAPSEELQFIMGHTTHLCERFQALIIKNDGNYFYICNMLTYDEVNELGGIKVYGWYDNDGYMDTVKKVFEEEGLIGKTIGVNSTERAFIILDIMQNVDVKFINGKPLLEGMRIIKSDEEIANLKKACQITDEVFTDLLGFVKAGQTEADVIQFMKDGFAKRGAEFGFAIVAAGKNAALPHYGGCDGIVTEHQPLLMDFGCIYNGLCSDMTRTVFIGEPTDEQRKMYEYVKRGTIAGENKAVNGAYIPDVDKAARDIVDESGFGHTFFTRLGHGIGYSLHEAPDIKQSNPKILQPGMTFSIEPGIYRVNEFGIRIEDLVLVTEEGNEVLYNSSKELIVVNNK